MSDCISREEALKGVQLYVLHGKGVELIPADYIRGLPEKKPEEKTGEWILDIDKSRGWDWRRFYCSACGSWQTHGEDEYCGNCGAKMRVEDKISELRKLLE